MTTTLARPAAPAKPKQLTFADVQPIAQHPEHQREQEKLSRFQAELEQTNKAILLAEKSSGVDPIQYASQLCAGVPPTEPTLRELHKKAGALKEGIARQQQEIEEVKIRLSGRLARDLGSVHLADLTRMRQKFLDFWAEIEADKEKRDALINKGYKDFFPGDPNEAYLKTPGARGAVNFFKVILPDIIEGATR